MEDIMVGLDEQIARILDDGGDVEQGILWECLQSDERVRSGSLRIRRLDGIVEYLQPYEEFEVA